MKTAGLSLRILAGMLTAIFLMTSPGGRVSATIQGGPALQLPWPSGVQHNINYGATYDCYRHTRMTAEPPYHENANYYAVDFALTYESVTAAAAGTVRFVGDRDDDYGRKVVVDHPGGYVSIYAHLDSWVVGQGASVTQGQLIGTSGNTGLSDGPHLHFHLQSGVNTAIPEPFSGVSNFGQYCLDLSPYWISRPPWQPEYAYQSYGTLWTGATGATAAASDFSQFSHSVLARVTGSGSVQWRKSLGGSAWGNWSTISGLSGVNGSIAISNHVYGSQDSVHVAAIKNGDLWYTRKIGTGSWSSWTNLGHPSGVTLNGAAAINNSGSTALVAAVANGNVYYRRGWGTSWVGWGSLGGASTLTGSLAVAMRPNGFTHIVALRSDGHIHITCTRDYFNWTGWTDIGWIFGDALGVDNDAASGGCGTTSNPGVAVLAFSGLVGYVFCWEAYCPLYESIGGAVQGPAAISNAVNPYSGNIRWLIALVRSSNSALVRYRVY